MSSYLKFYQEFLQNKEKAVRSSQESQENEDRSSIEEKRENVIIKPKPDNMEHSYIRDSNRPCGEITGLTTRSLFVRRPPQCPSCHSHPAEESDLDDPNQPSIPAYNEIAAKDAMNECSRIAKSVKNMNSDDDDWEAAVNKNGWSKAQKQLFEKVTRILDLDQLGRLANFGRQTEAMQRRVLIDKSAKRFRKALASVTWDARLTQWLHGLLMDCLPPSYIASYLDILQTLKNKLPTLMDKMLFGRPMNISQELLAPVLKKRWEPVITTNKQRKLMQDAVIVAIPSMPTNGPVPSRIQKWYQHLASITQIVQISLPMGGNSMARQPLEQIAEQIVSLTRIKIQELRNEQPPKAIILVGFNAGAAMALQVAISEAISCVICMGFAFNTLNGIRGSPDDRILDIKSPIMFVIGQNSARTSQEEIESLREKMQSETSLVVVGSADDVLRVPKSRRKIENITQSMVDVMIIDEVYEFLKKILANPPGPRIPTSVTNPLSNTINQVRKITSADIQGNRKRKQSQNQDGQIPAKIKYGNTSGRTPIGQKLPKKPKIQDPFQVKRKVGRPRTRPYPPAVPLVKSSSNMVTSTPISAKQHHQQKQLQTNDDLNSAIQSILGESSENLSSSLTEIQSDNNNSSATDAGKIVTNYEIVAQSKSTPIKTALLKSGIKTAFIGNRNVITTSTLGRTSKTSNTFAPNSAMGTKIKMIPSNQFVQLKPPIQSQSKIYTIKTTSMLNNSSSSSTTGVVSKNNSNSNSSNTSTPSQLYTFKSSGGGTTTQFITASPTISSSSNNHQKYTVVKTNAPILGSTITATNSKTQDSGSGGGDGDDLSNIFDMPIVFADNDGNLTEPMTITTTSSTTTPSSGQLILNPNAIKEAAAASSSSSSAAPHKGSYIINSSAIQQQQQQQQATQKLKQPNKVVFINRNTMKPCPNIISRSNIAQQLPKYTKVVVTNPKTSVPTLVARASGQPQQTTTSTVKVNQSAGPLNQSAITSTVKQINIQSLKSPPVSGGSSGKSTQSSSGILNLGRGGGISSGNIKSLQQFQIINVDSSEKQKVIKTANATNSPPGDKLQTAAAATTTSTTAAAPVATPPQTTQMKNTIVLKPGGLKQIPMHLTTQLLNRNLTVRKLVNLVPANKTSGVISTTVSQLQAGAVSQQNAKETTNSGDSSSSSSGNGNIKLPKASIVTESPKVIKLNPTTTSPKQKTETE